MKIGICGGTFDPFHRGHIDPILAVRETMQWDRITYIPAFVQPFKRDRETSSPFHRFAMTVLGTEEQDGVHVDPRELERGAVSYSVDTLEGLRKEHRHDTIDWIIGDDNLESLHEWKSIDRIFELANFVVLTRTAQTTTEEMACVADASTRPSHGAIVYADNATIPISSTEIRRRVGAGEPIEELVGARVSRYIHINGLYRKGHT